VRLRVARKKNDNEASSITLKTTYSTKAKENYICVSTNFLEEKG
jgi:hypothetical protein